MAKRISQAKRGALQRKLRRLRLAAGLTQVELSKKLKRQQSYVSKYESGERKVDLLEVREICRALGASLAQFAKDLERDLD